MLNNNKVRSIVKVKKMCTKLVLELKIDLLENVNLLIALCSHSSKTLLIKSVKTNTVRQQSLLFQLYDNNYNVKQ